jgi:hypothetical protein
VHSRVERGDPDTPRSGHALQVDGAIDDLVVFHGEALVSWLVEPQVEVRPIPEAVDLRRLAGCGDQLVQPGERQLSSPAASIGLGFIELIDDLKRNHELNRRTCREHATFLIWSNTPLDRGKRGRELILVLDEDTRVENNQRADALSPSDAFLVQIDRGRSRSRVRASISA